jgi:hypothetical protein
MKKIPLIMNHFDTDKEKDLNFKDKRLIAFINIL